MKEEILKLRDEGKTYDEIVKIVGCTKSTVSYHCGKGQKEKTNERRKKYIKSHPINRKIDSYKSRKSLKNKTERFQMRLHSEVNERKGGLAPSLKDVQLSFYKEDVFDKFGESPRCYLTGRTIDWNDGLSYTLDHIIPVSKGGDNTIDNLELAHPHVNYAKGDLTVEEFVILCKEVVEYMGV